MTMSMHLWCVVLSIALTGFAIREIYEIKVNPEDFAIDHRLIVNGNYAHFFRFLTQENIIEKLLPWLTRFKEADARALSVGKLYRAFLELPIFGLKKIYLTVVDYRPTNLLILESNDTLIGQRVEIRTECQNDRTIFRTTIQLQKTSIVYHYTVGIAVRYYMQRHLENSSLTVAELYRLVGEPRRVLENLQ